MSGLKLTFLVFYNIFIIVTQPPSCCHQGALPQDPPRQRMPRLLIYYNLELKKKIRRKAGAEYFDF